MTSLRNRVGGQVGLAFISVAILATWGCGRSQLPTQPTAVPPAATSISEVAKAYLEALIQIMETYTIDARGVPLKSAVDWASFRTQVLAAAGVAQTIPDTYPAIGLALRMLNVYHSVYLGRDGQAIPGISRGCSSAAPPPTTPRLPDTVAYVKVDRCNCEGSAATQFAESLQQAIRTADRVGLAGWIVDLRGNGGGNMWPMLAGIGPVLGEGIVGYIVYPDREYAREYRAGAALSLGEVFARVGTPYTLLNPHPKVAVLTDGTVASSGEAIVAFFRGRPATRSFGSPTCGLSTATGEFPLSDGALLLLPVALMADRTKRTHGDVIPPDEIVSDPGQAVERAIAWLQGGTDY